MYPMYSQLSLKTPSLGPGSLESVSRILDLLEFGPKVIPFSIPQAGAQDLGVPQAVVGPTRRTRATSLGHGELL